MVAASLAVPIHTAAGIIPLRDLSRAERELVGTKAANLGGSLFEAPMTVAPVLAKPSEFMYRCRMSAVSSFEPAKAKPMPSSSDFFPISITSDGILASCV